MKKAIRFGKVGSDYWGYSIHSPDSKRIPICMATIEKREDLTYLLTWDTQYQHVSDSYDDAKSADDKARDLIKLATFIIGNPAELRE